MPLIVGILLLYLLSVGGFLLLARTGGPKIVPCLFYNATGRPCFLCGGTRTTIAMAQGDWVVAFTTNPLVALALTAALAALAYHLIQGRFPIKLTPPGKLTWFLIAAAVIANWWWVWSHLPY